VPLGHFGTVPGLSVSEWCSSRHRRRWRDWRGDGRRSSWNRAVRANVPLDEECIEAFDLLTGNGVDAPVTDRGSPRFAPPH